MGWFDAGRISLLAASLLACFLTEREAVAADPSSVIVAEHQAARFDIVVADDTEENVPPLADKPFEIEFGNMRSSVWESAHLLADYLGRATGATFAVRRESQPARQPGAIHVGPTAYTARHFAADTRAADLDRDGFIHHVIDEQHIVILGGSDLGTEFGVYDFLERHVNVRWLFPGELGEFVPSLDALDIPAEFWRDEPWYLSRLIRPHRVEGGLTWARRQRARIRVEFHHNISKLYPVKLTQEHPDLYPLIDGQRYLPPSINMDTWHPCYTAADSVPVTAGLIKDFFARYPRYDSISLGITDAGESRNCHCPTCIARYPGTLNTLGFDERSDVYYDWCNQVVADVRRAYPDKRFGLIAYRGVTDPPGGFKLDDSLVPFLCFDRMLWADASRAAQDRRMTEAWSRAAVELGWYDYIYGEAYVLPRIYSRVLQAALRFGRDHQVRHYYAEADPSQDWHEGPKYYIVMKLLWNPDADVDALLRDWCEAAVGRGAAPDLVRYFTFLEDLWTNRVPRTAWFGDRSRIYLIFNAMGYLDAMTQADVEQCSQWLKQVEASAGDAAQKRRAKLLREGFERRRRETIDYFMFNNQIPDDPALTRDVKRVAAIDFDTQPAGWEAFSSENRGAWHWDQTGGRDGGALRVDNATAVIHRGIEVRPAGKYRISGWYSLEGALPDSARLALEVEWRDQNRDEFRLQKPTRLLPVEGDGRWHSFTMVCAPPRVPGRAGQSMGLAILFHNATDSTVRFDGITITEIVTRK